MASAVVTATDLAYAFCSALLLGMATFVWLRGRHSVSHRTFALTAFSLLAWLVTLWFFNRASEPQTVLWLGRANFASIVPATLLAYLFVRAVAGLPQPPYFRWLLYETVLLTFVTALTPLVDREEHVLHVLQSGIATSGFGNHTTVYGLLFVPYLLHVAVFLGAAVWTALSERSREKDRHAAVRDQLLLVGGGTLATGLISLITNALLPYSLGNFRYIDVGPLSTVLFMVAVAWATVRHRLFAIRIFVRKALVYGLLLSLSLAAYSAVLVLATDRLAQNGSDSVTRFGVLVIAFAFDPLRRIIERHLDRLLDQSLRHRR